MHEQNGHDVDLLPVPHNGEENGSLGYYTYYNTPPPPTNGKKQIEKVLDMLFRRKWIIIAVFLATTVLAYGYSITRTPEFQASGFVLVNLGPVTVDLSKGISSDVDTNGEFELFARNDRSLSGEIRLLEISDQLRQRVYQRLQNNTEEVAGLEHLSLSSLRYMIRFSPESGTKNIIRFTGKSSDAEQAALLTNLYSEEYVRLTRDASRTQAYSLRESLERKEEEQRKEVEVLEEQIKRLSSSGVVDLDREATRLVSQITTLEIQYDDSKVEYEVEQAALLALEQELEEINPQLAQRIASGIDRRILALQEELGKVEDIRSQFLIQYPELRDGKTDALKQYDDEIESLRLEIDSLSMQYVDEVASSGGISGSADGLVYVANLRQQIASRRVTVNRLKARIDVLEGRLESYRESVSQLPRQSMELAQLERTRVRVDRLYQNTVDELQKAYIAEESQPGYAQIVQKAKVPTASVYPDTQRDLILGSFFGLLLGLGIAVMRDKFDYRIYQRDELRSMGLKEIGVVPDMKPLIKKEYKGKEFHEVDEQNMSTSLIPFLQPVTAVAEAYRYIRTHLNVRLTENSTQVLLLTSPGMSEGKSTTAANMAIVMAQSGRNVLLIDADLRRPRLHKLFGRSREGGLIELLVHESESEDSAGSWKTSVENLDLLTAGKPVSREALKESDSDLPAPSHVLSNPSELLSSDQMREFVKSMSEQYDLIVIDTPPILAAADALLLSSLSDGVLLVVRSGVTKEGELEMAVEALDDVGANVLGTILNGFDVGNAIGHKYKYQNYSKYGHYSDYAD